MNFSIFLIILDFVYLVFSSEDHATNDSCNVCTLSWFRRKRDLKEYRRWPSNAETTHEFIVKVLDDDVVTPHIKDLVAVNIASFTKAREKIIIGGPITPSLTTLSDLDKLKEYTRFGPPTTLTVTSIEGSKILAPIKFNENAIAPIRPPGNPKLEAARLPQRDESPPANPQFLPRIPAIVARQYAPISPVSFNKRSSSGPPTPRLVDNSILDKSTPHPTRSSVASQEVPMRTLGIITFVPLEYSFPLETSKISARTSALLPKYLHRTSNNVPIKNYDFRTTSAYTSDSRKHIVEAKVSQKTGLKRTDISYNDLVYNDDDDETNVSKTKNSQSTTEIYEDNNKNSIDSFIQDTISVIDSEEFENTTDIDQTTLNDEDEDSSENTKISTKTKPIFGVATIKLQPDVSNNTIKVKKHICSILKLRQLSFSSPQTLHEIVTQLKQWAEESPVAKLADITEGNLTIMENPIYMITVDDPSSGQIVSAKQTVMIVAGIQGRDHHAVTAAMYVLYQLIERTEAHSYLLTKFRFWIIPVFNPDGYDYSITFPARREWMKNLRQSWDSCKGRASCRICEEFGLRCTIQPCYGVNLDRNFEYQWIPTEELRSEHPCGSLYAGPRQLSESETQALTHFLHDRRSPLYTFIAFKEGDILGIMYPYSHTKKRRAFDNIYRQRASRAAAAAHSISGRLYVAGQTSEFLCVTVLALYAGGIEDWVDGHLGIDNTYTVMLFRPTDAQNSKVVTERVVHEAYAAVDTLILQGVEPFGLPQTTVLRARASGNTIFSRSIILTAVMLGFG